MAYLLGPCVPVRLTKSAGPGKLDKFPKNSSQKFRRQHYYMVDILRRKTMNVTADQRRTVLRLFNVSEAARLIGLPVQDMYHRIRAGQLPAPQIPLGRRCYFSADE